MFWLWRSIIISSITGLAILLFIFYSETGNLPDLRKNTVEILSWLLLSSFVGFTLFHLNKYFNKVFPWNKNLTARFLLETVSGTFLLGIAALIFMFVFLHNLPLKETETSFWSEYWDGGIKFGIVSLVIIYVYALINFSIYSYLQYSKGQVEALKIERLRLKLQFEALKTQLSPHFLFNALNTISSLIYKDAKIAEDFIRRLAYTYNYILESNKSEITQLSKEVKLVQDYFFMQKIKYDQSVELSVNLNDAVLETYVPPLAIQMLIENALKHNRISEEKKLYISLEETQDNMIVVKNNIIPKPELLKIGNNLIDRPEMGKPHKIGLSNIKKRYAYFTSRKIEVIANDFFIVKLPVIERD